MENYIVWPNCWLNLAFVGACVALILMFFIPKIGTKNKDEVSVIGGKTLFDIVFNKYLWLGLSILISVSGFILLLCLLKTAGVDGIIYSFYVGFCIIVVMFIYMTYTMSGIRDYTLSVFVVALAQSIGGLVLLVYVSFPYMWYAVGLVILNIIGIVVQQIKQ